MNTVTCPTCAKLLKGKTPIRPGSLVKCPGCQGVFNVPAETAMLTEAAMPTESAFQTEAALQTKTPPIPMAELASNPPAVAPGPPPLPADFGLEDEEEERLPPLRNRRDRDDGGERGSRSYTLADDDDDESLPPHMRKKRGLVREGQDDDDRLRKKNSLWEEEGDSPRPKKKKSRLRDPWDRPRRDKPRYGSESSAAGAVLGGIAMMAIAVVWFVLGLMANRIFFYPLVLFVVGIIAVCKGMFGSSD